MNLLLKYVNESIERDEQRINFWRELGDDEYADGMVSVLRQLEFVSEQLEELTQKQTQTKDTHASI